jgi:hypothetical protein
MIGQLLGTVQNGRDVFGSMVAGRRRRWLDIRARQPRGSIAPTALQQRGGGLVVLLLRETTLDIDRVPHIALKAIADARLAAILLPGQQIGAWRVELRKAHMRQLACGLRVHEPDGRDAAGGPKRSSEPFQVCRRLMRRSEGLWPLARHIATSYQ